MASSSPSADTAAASDGAAAAAARSAPLASVGVLSDIQCADLPDGSNYLRTETRYYRHALVAAKRALRRLADNGAVQAVLHFGDLIDGWNAAPENDCSERMLAEALRVMPAPAVRRSLPFDSIPPAPADAPDPWPGLRSFHLIGNHELMNLPRSRWARDLGMGRLARESARESRDKVKQLKASNERVIQSYLFPCGLEEAELPSADAPYSSSSPLYYEVRVAERYRLLMLDAYDVGTLGFEDEEGHAHARMAREFLEKENPNDNKLSPLNLTGVERRKVGFNGGMSQRQVEWIEAQLADCERQGHYALLCSHVCFHPCAAHQSALLWNMHELLALVSRYSGSILACLHGHDHDGGHAVDEHGVQHHTVEAILTTPDGQDCFGRLDFYEDRVELVGYGLMSSCTFPVPAKRATADKQQSNGAHSQAHPAVDHCSHSHRSAKDQAPTNGHVPNKL